MRKLAGAFFGLLLIGGLVAVGYAVRLATEPAQPPPTTIPTETVAVVRTDLVRTETLDGTLGFESRAPLRATVPGTVTALPAEADPLARGDVAFEIDGEPVFVLYGGRPAWRPMADGVDEGVDVLQLEENLAALGFGPDDWEPDEEFDWETADAVEDWREEVGLPEGDDVELGRVAFVEGEIRVGALLAEIGQLVTAGLPVFEATELSQQVSIELDPDDIDLVEVGGAVEVVLPDGRRYEGAIVEVGRVVRPAGPEPEAPEVIEVVVSLPETILDLDQAPVEVEVESERAADVLAVPVGALISLSDGGYAVDTGDDLIGVETGDFAGGLVEISGGVEEGDEVVVPR